MRLRRAVRGEWWRLPAWLAAAPFVPLLVVFASGDEWSGRHTVATLLLAAAVIALDLRRAADTARAAAAAPAVTEAGKSVAALTAHEPIPARKLRYLDRWASRISHGWSASATAKLMSAANTDSRNPEYQVRALTAVCDHYAARRRERRPARSLELDIVLVSALDLLGGTTSSNEAEIQAFRDAGLTVGLVHHPVYSRTDRRPVHPRLLDLVDDEQVFLLGPADTVRCDLAIVRFPVAFEHLMEDRPQVAANRTVLLVNQAPFEEYGLTGGYGTSWSITDVHRNVSEWLGEHTWYAIGPAIRDVLAKHHAEELAGIDQALDFWYGTIDVEAWRPQAPRVRGEGDPIRIGRHSRDHVTKFPNMAKRLRTAYPDAEDIEVHLLGGSKAVTKLLGAVPKQWTSHPFGSLAPADFLGDLDLYVYFIDENLLEAFGRSPLEAMAAGVPCILPWSFEELFGDAGVYCEPAEVEERARALMADPAAYERQVRAGWRLIEERFSPRALLRRVSGLGVAVDPALLHRTETDPRSPVPRAALDAR